MMDETKERGCTSFGREHLLPRSCLVAVYATLLSEPKLSLEHAAAYLNCLF